MKNYWMVSSLVSGAIALLIWQSGYGSHAWPGRRNDIRLRVSREHGKSLSLFGIPGHLSLQD